MLKTLKILSAVSYLFIFIPGEKISVPMGMIMFLAPLLGIAGGQTTAWSLLLDLAFLYLLISAIKKNINPTLDLYYSLFCFACFAVFILIGITAIFTYGNLYTFVPLVIWIAVTAFCILALFRRNAFAHKKLT